MKIVQKFCWKNTRWKSAILGKTLKDLPSVNVAELRWPPVWKKGFLLSNGPASYSSFRCWCILSNKQSALWRPTTHLLAFLMSWLLEVLGFSNIASAPWSAVLRNISVGKFHFSICLALPEAVGARLRVSTTCICPDNIGWFQRDEIHRSV